MNDEIKKQENLVDSQSYDKEWVDERIKHIKSLYENGTYVELKEQDIMKVLKASYIAERFFGKSRSWITHKLNHDLKNGKPDEFTNAEKKRLSEALYTIALEIQKLADEIVDEVRESESK
jgi:hypothetical protein